MSVLKYIEELFTKDENKDFDKDGKVMKATIFITTGVILFFTVIWVVIIVVKIM